MENVLYVLRELTEDTSVPKNLRAKLANTINSLEKEGQTSLGIAKAMEQLERMTEDLNIEPFIRTQLFNVVSLLEVARIS